MNLWPILTYFGILALEFDKNKVIFKIINPGICKIGYREKDTLNLVSKMSFWLNLGENLKNLLSYFISTPSTLSDVSFYVKQKTVTFGTKSFMKNLLTELSLRTFCNRTCLSFWNWCLNVAIKMVQKLMCLAFSFS